MIVLEIGANWEGHSSMKITQEYYGKVVQKRVGEEMNRISSKLR
jgi:integrase/recombinase XerD